MKIAGLDIGTTGCKCTVFDEEGKYLNKAYRDYPVRRRAGAHEIDVSVIMGSVFQVLREMAEEYPDIAGIGITSFGETFVLTDAHGEPLHLAMLYTDPRGEEEAAQLSQRLGARRIASLTGLRPSAMYSLPKLMWLKAHMPETYEKAEHCFLMQDYVVWHLTGVAQIDHSLASRTMGFDIRQLAWSDEVFQAAGVDAGLFSKPVPTGTAAGCLTAEAALAIGLERTVQVISISHDQVAAAIGAGVFDGSQAVDGAGTCECLTPVYEQLPDAEIMYQGYFSVVPYVKPGRYVAYAFTYTGGALIDWCIRQLAAEAREKAAEAGLTPNGWLEKAYIEEHGDVPSGLLVLPHFAGAATPYMDNGSKGAILGLTTDTGVQEIYRACMEGVAYEMRLNMEKLAGSGCAFKALRATGGGAHSAVWMQMKADVLDLPMIALRTVDAGTVGSAMLTGVAVGLFRDLDDAAGHMVEMTERYEPRPEKHQEYMQIFERYAKLYDAVRPLM